MRATIEWLQEAFVAKAARDLPVPDLLTSVIRFTGLHKQQVAGCCRAALVKEGGRFVWYGSLFYKGSLPLQSRRLPEIHGLWIEEHSRNRGLGTLLIATLEEEAQSRGYEGVGLGVGDSEGAYRLYQRLGYRPVARGDGCRVLFWMEKHFTLSP